MGSLTCILTILIISLLTIDAETKPMMDYTGTSLPIGITEGSVDTFGRILTQNPDIVYIHVTFGWFIKNGVWFSYTPYVGSDTFIPHGLIERFKFNLLFGDRGLTLGTLPPIFQPLSLFTLSPGVFETEIRINFNPRENPHNNFITYDENPDTKHPYSATADTLDIIAKTLVNVTDEVIMTLQSPVSLRSSQLALSSICQETYGNAKIYESDVNTFKASVLKNTFNIVYEQSFLVCYNVKTMSKHTIKQDSHLQEFVLFAVIPLSILSPLALLFVLQCKQSPEFKNGRVLLNEDTDLPVGVKYFFFYWVPKGFGGFIVYCIRLCMFVFIILFPNYLIIYIMHGRLTYLKHPDNHVCFCLTDMWCPICKTFDIYLLIIKCTIIPLTLEIIMLVFISANNSTFQIAKNGYQILFTEDENERTKLFPWLTLPQNLQIPKHPDNLQIGLATLLYYSSQRINLIVNYKLWMQVLQKFTNDIRYAFCDNPVWTLVWIVILWPAIVVCLFSAVFFNIIPTTYIIYRLLKMSTMFKCKIFIMLFFLFQLSVILILSINIFSLIYLLGQVIVFFITGLILNTSAVSSILILLVSLFGYIAKSFLNIYDTYHKVLLTIIDKVTQIDEFVAERPKIMPKMGRLDNRSKKSDDIKIDVNLFWFVVEKCRPLRMTVMGTVFKIICAIFIIILAMKVLTWTHQLQKMNDVSTTMATVLAIIVTPQVLAYMKSKASMKQDKSLFGKSVLQAVKEYRVQLLFQESEDSDEELISP